MLQQIKETTEYLKKIITQPIDAAIILGTGLGALSNEIETIATINYDTIPNFPISTVEGHQGALIYGTIGDKHVLAMKGRFHYYEGYSMKEVTFPIRVFNALKIKNLFISNASGGLNPTFKVGDIMIIDDHINFFPEHPLRGKNEESLGHRFPDMSQSYNKQLIMLAEKEAAALNIEIKRGTYLGTSGPTFETPAEYKMFRILGADAVGMSTVPEVIVARHMDMTCFAVSIITDSGVPGEIVEVSHEEVQKVAAQAEPKMTALMKRLIVQL